MNEARRQAGPALAAKLSAARAPLPNPEVETYAVHACDGMNMRIWAIQEAGLNRAKIRDGLGP